MVQTIIIETPKNCSVKFKWDPEQGIFKVKKSLPLGMVFPYAFGYIAGTKGEDGDPLDAVAISNEEYFTGCHLEARLIGALLAEQKEKGIKKFRNDRYFFIPGNDLVFEHIKSIADFGKKHNQQLIDFFINYNKAEEKVFNPIRLVNAEAASALLKKAIRQS